MAGASFNMDMSKMLGWAGKEVDREIQNRQLAEELGEMLVSSTQQRFEDEQAPDGSKWKSSRRARATGGITLTDTAELKNSIGYSATSTGVSVGSNKIYAAIHQYGGTIKAKNGKLKFKLPNGGFAQVDKVDIPQREFLGISDEDKEEAQEIIRNFMMEALSQR
jgi:phage virion morphogenesis protein